MELKATGDVKIIGPATEKIPGIDMKVTGGDVIEFGRTKAEIIEVGGHTKGHIAYYFEDDAKVFVGDSLFALVSWSAGYVATSTIYRKLRSHSLAVQTFVIHHKGLW